MSQVRIKISSSNITETVVDAVWDGRITHKLERDRIYHLSSLKSEITLYGDDFTLVEGLADDCERISVVVEVFCGGSWVEHSWSGYFTKFDCKFDYVRCSLTAKVKTDDLYDCLLKEWNDEINIYSGTGSTIVTRAFAGTYIAGQGCCKYCSPSFTLAPCNDFSLTDYCAQPVVVTQPSSGYCAGQYLVTTCYHRVLGVGTPTTPPPYGDPGDWTYISGNDWWRCPDFSEITVGVLQYGRRFDAVLEYLVAQTGCGLTVRSHFFGINATHAAAPSNDAYTYADEHYQDLTVHQKSDVKRPDSTNPSLSFIWDMKLKDLLADLQTIFNVFWKIDGTSLIIEHVSYFGQTAGGDYSTRKMPRTLEYDSEAPNKEVFVWSDRQCSTVFEGDPIEYDCGNGEVERRVTLFSTDVGFIRSEQNHDIISDENFVLVSNKLDGSDYWVSNFNRALGWQNLHDNLHRHYRPFTSGSLNGSSETFLSTQAIKKQPSFTVPNCCDSGFDPGDYVTTPLGNGTVQEATENLKQDTVELQLNY
ncbi:MAG: hypothetical protein KDC70_00190 [Saprospiraceae bacterium]|nr:hypothetical protein [Saprospiraceae bacterium]